MQHIRFRLLALATLLGVGILLFSLDRSTTLAVEGGSYVLDWQTIGFGGGVSTGGAYEVSSTVGQASAEELTGGSYTVGGGFWGGGPRAIAPTTPTATVTPSTTGTPSAGTPSPTATATPTPPGNTNSAVKLYLPLVDR
jgi:hypothetical protein